MCLENRELLAAQSEVGQLLRNGNYPTLKVMASRCGIKCFNSFTGYFPADEHAKPTELPGHKLLAVIAGLPAELADLLMPDGYRVVEVPDAMDHDDLAEAVQDYLAAKEAAHRKDSPAGRDISDCERSVLNIKAASIVGRVGQ